MGNTVRSLAMASLVATLTCASVSARGDNIEPKLEFTDAETKTILSLAADVPPPIDQTNRFADNSQAVELGRSLFFDRRISANGAISCASCHDPKRGWSDGRRLSLGLQLGTRKTPTLANVAYYRWFFRDGRAATLWQQALQPINDRNEMGGTNERVFEAIVGDVKLRHAYEITFGVLPESTTGCTIPAHYGSECNDIADLVAVNAAKSLAAFMGTLVYRCSPFDKFADGLRIGDPVKQAAISEDAKRGLRIFLGSARCINCHHGPILSDSEFHDARVPGWPDRFREDHGRYDGISALLNDRFGPNSRYSDSRDGTMAKWIGFLHKTPETMGQFKTPTLRNVELTGPYTHAGRYETLAQVIDHYSEMSDAFLLNHHDYALMEPLNLSSAEKSQMVEFLKTLTDPDLRDGRYPSSKCAWR